MHVYEPRSFTKEKEQILRETAGPSKCIQNFLTQTEFDLCRRLFDTNIAWPEHGQVSKYWGFDWNTGYGPLLQWIRPKIDQLFPGWELDFLAIQEGITPWKVHADIRWYENKIPYKVMLMPIDVIPASGPVDFDQWPDTFTIAFNQRNFLSTWQEHATARTGNLQEDWIRPVDNPQIERLVPGFNVTNDQWLEYFDHMPYEHLEGLTIDAIHKWTPGSLMYWDNTTVHCADNFLGRGIKTKRSLMVFSTIKH